MEKLIRMSIILLSSCLLASMPLMAKKVSRDKQAIFDIDGGRVSNPYQMNYLVPGGTPRNAGLHQAMWEPLFILNYETGKIDPWLGVSFTPNSFIIPKPTGINKIYSLSPFFVMESSVSVLIL